jgi:hypothetical protein
MNNPNRRFSDRLPSLPYHADPQSCPLCGPDNNIFVDENQPDMHYFQVRILKAPRVRPSNAYVMRDHDLGNYDGPLGGGRHIFA